LGQRAIVLKTYCPKALAQNIQQSILPGRHKNRQPVHRIGTFATTGILIWSEKTSGSSIASFKIKCVEDKKIEKNITIGSFTIGEMQLKWQDQGGKGKIQFREN